MPDDVTFRDVLWAMAHAADANPDPAAGPVTLNALDRARYTAHLQTAIRQLWAPPAEDRIVWPETIAGAEVAVTDGRIARNLLGAGDFWTVWTSDPRIDYDPQRPDLVEALRVSCEYDADSIYPSTTQASVFVFYRRAVPLFTATRVDTTRTYNPSAGSEEIPATPAQANLTVDSVRAIIFTIQVNGGTAVVYTLAFNDPEDDSHWVDLTTYNSAGLAVARLKGLIIAAQGDVLTVVTYSAPETLGIFTQAVGAAATLVMTRNESTIPGWPINETGRDAIPAYEEGVNKPHLVFDELDTGHVYKAIAQDALGSALDNTAKWQVQGIPARLLEPLHVHAEVLRVRAKGLYDESRKLQVVAEEVLRQEQFRVFYAPGQAPWLKMPSTL